MDITIEIEHRERVPHWVPRALGALGLTSGGLFSGLLALAWYVVHRITAPTPTTPFDTFTFTPFELGLPYEAVVFPSADGTMLRGWWIPQPGSRRVVITCSGHRGRRSEMLGIAAALWRDGNNVLMFDYRGHGELIGTPVTLGYREVQDFLIAIEWVKGRVIGASIGAIGYSMGAAVAIMGAARCDDVRAVVADSPFARQREVVSLHVRRVLHIPHGPLLDLTDLLLGRLNGYHFRDVEPLREIPALAPRPILLIHGAADSITNPHDSEALYAAASEPKELWITPGVEHCGTYFADRTTYCDRVGSFFRRALEPATQAHSGMEDAQPAR